MNPDLSILTIAGSDSSGGAGVQADLKTITSFGCYGASVITALTAQNTLGVQAVHPCPPDFIEQQVISVLEDIPIHSIKTGMLYDAQIIQVIVRALKTHANKVPPLVCDPVCVSTSGDTLLQPEALGALIKELFPMTTLLTPNIPEAVALLSHTGQSIQINSLENMATAAEKLLGYGCRAVLLKGGHLAVKMADVQRLSRDLGPRVSIIRYGLTAENTEILRAGGGVPPVDLLVADILHEGRTVTLFIRPHINSKNTHGTGCTLSAALACELARSSNIIEAIKSATAYVHRGIEAAPRIGMGYGPLNHIHSVTRVPLSKPSLRNPYPLTTYFIENSQDVWKAYVQHDFVIQLGKGVLDKKSFVHFITQDYHYLKYYARAYGFLAAKSTNFSAITDAAETVLDIIREIQTHKLFCDSFGVSAEELEKIQESTTTTAYGAFILDMGLQGDDTKLFMAVIACLLGYGEVGLWLKSEAAKENSWVVLEGNPYKEWIDVYSGPHYQAAVRKGLGIIEKRAMADPPSAARLMDWLAVWIRCTELEKRFWDMAMDISW
ncbi:hypothetical protein AMATHDRAFT_137124 [Amanita thiersii Skay4041]|uniref:Pyridoxamine kinase/Phosphomethylpyrimidine kinase domain-containing protein n=1 Tax=Amanita thiersii Skay4041 TaxID=703135 RepID=A0A2A9NZT1_9AGAR|nr:hypothetical protein AMATHDRAFT_137124 [Amanita thiersii Skay4041]